jgi:hypothetical protein
MLNGCEFNERMAEGVGLERVFLPCHKSTEGATEHAAGTVRARRIGGS